MEQITSLENQNSDQTLNQTPPQNNNYKILFFVSLALFLIISTILAIFLVKNNQKQPKLITKNEQTQTVSSITPTETVISPTVIISEETNILKISDIQMELPKNWKISSVSGNNAKILTDYSKYQVYLTLKLNKNDSIAESSYESAVTKTKIDYGEVFDVAQGGAKGVTGAVVNGNKYSFEWNIESNQPTPTNLDGVWRPDDNITSKMLLDITKTIKPLIEISSIPKDWKTYTDKEIGFSFNYPKNITLTKKLSDGVFSLAINTQTNLAGGVNMVTGITANRGGSCLDFGGYTKNGNQITYFYNKDKSTVCDSKLVKKIYNNPNGLEIVLLEGVISEEQVGPCEGELKALINTKNKTYPGLAFISIPTITESDLMKILDTLKFN